MYYHFRARPYDPELEADNDFYLVTKIKNPKLTGWTFTSVSDEQRYSVLPCAVRLDVAYKGDTVNWYSACWIACWSSSVSLVSQLTDYFTTRNYDTRLTYLEQMEV